MLVSVDRIERDDVLHKLFRVYYHQTCMPKEVQSVRYTAKDELDAYKKFKPYMYRAYGLTVFVVAATKKLDLGSISCYNVSIVGV